VFGAEFILTPWEEIKTELKNYKKEHQGKDFTIFPSGMLFLLTYRDLIRVRHKIAKSDSDYR